MQLVEVLQIDIVFVLMAHKPKTLFWTNVLFYLQPKKRYDFWCEKKPTET